MSLAGLFAGRERQDELVLDAVRALRLEYATYPRIVRACGLSAFRTSMVLQRLVVDYRVQRHLAGAYGFEDGLPRYELGGAADAAVPVVVWLKPLGAMKLVDVLRDLGVGPGRPGRVLRAYTTPAHHGGLDAMVVLTAKPGEQVGDGSGGGGRGGVRDKAGR